MAGIGALTTCAFLLKLGHWLPRSDRLSFRATLDEEFPENAPLHPPPALPAAPVRRRGLDRPDRAGSGAAPAQDSAALIVIHAGTLLDRPGRPPRRNATIVVRNGRIESVQDGFVAAARRRAADRPVATASCCRA